MSSWSFIYVCNSIQEIFCQLYHISDLRSGTLVTWLSILLQISALVTAATYLVLRQRFTSPHSFPKTLASITTVLLHAIWDQPIRRLPCRFQFLDFLSMIDPTTLLLLPEHLTFILLVVIYLPRNVEVRLPFTKTTVLYFRQKNRQ